MKKNFIALTLFLLTACDHTWECLHISAGNARKIIKYELSHHRLPERIFAKTAVTDEKTAVVAAEEILFPIFGKATIREELPYTIGYADGYWLVYGYPPPDYHSGVFEIIIYAKTGEVVHWMHGK